MRTITVQCTVQVQCSTGRVRTDCTRTATAEYRSCFTFTSLFVLFLVASSKLNPKANTFSAVRKRCSQSILVKIVVAQSTNQISFYSILYLRPSLPVVVAQEQWRIRAWISGLSIVKRIHSPRMSLKLIVYLETIPCFRPTSTRSEPICREDLLFGS